MYEREDLNLYPPPMSNQTLVPTFNDMMRRFFEQADAGGMGQIFGSDGTAGSSSWLPPPPGGFGPNSLFPGGSPLRGFPMGRTDSTDPLLANGSRPGTSRTEKM